MGSVDTWAHLLLALAQDRPEDLKVGNLGDSVAPVLTICFASPKMDLFLRVTKNKKLLL